MSDNRLSGTLQTITHALVVGAGLVYLFGFIIISVFDATYGIADFALFRTKVVAVGTLFVVLVALAMLLTFRMFSFFGLTSDRAEGSEFVVLPQNWPFRTTDAALSLPFGCVGLTNPLIFLFSRYPEWRRLGLALFV